MTTDPHSAGCRRDSWEHEESTEMSGGDLLVVHEQCQRAGFHGDRQLNFTGSDFAGANQMGALVSIHNIEVGSPVIKPKSPSTLVIAECGDDSAFAGWAINDGRHREATKH